jgi:hypothetical protein
MCSNSRHSSRTRIAEPANRIDVPIRAGEKL